LDISGFSVFFLDREACRALPVGFWLKSGSTLEKGNKIDHDSDIKDFAELTN
jgi:hypothetical protein